MKRPRVLIVDDNAMNLEIAELLLADAGFDTATALDAARALAAWRQARPDLVLLDIQMPGQDGLALAGQLRAEPGGEAVPLVAFTAYAMKGDRERLLAAGLDGYIAKPIDAAHFADQVRAWLRPAGRGPAAD